MNGQDIYLMKSLVGQRQQEIRHQYAEAGAADGPTVPGLALGIITALLVALLGR